MFWKVPFSEKDHRRLKKETPLEGGKTKDCAVCIGRRQEKESKSTTLFRKTWSNNPGLIWVKVFKQHMFSYVVKKIKTEYWLSVCMSDKYM